MSNRIFIKVFIIAMICFATSCRNDKPEVIAIRLIPTELKAYWDFKPGTYWIYKDSTTGVADTVTVVDYKNETFQSTLSYDQDIIGLCEKLIIYTIRPSGLHEDFGINSSNAGSSHPLYMTVVHSKYGGIDGYHATKCFVYPLFIGNATYDSQGMDDTCIIRNIYENAFGFADVIQIDQNFNTVEGDQPTKWFWAKHIGVIRKEYPDGNRVVSLIDYHIEPWFYGSNNSYQVVLDVSSLSSGVYLLKAVELNGNALLKKLVVD